MAAVIRVKRRLDEQPLESLLLNCKRRKTTNNEETNSSDVSAFLKFAGTVDNQVQNEDIFKHITKPTKAELEDHFKRHNTDVVQKLRAENQRNIKDNRYKVVNSFRSSKDNEDEASGPESQVRNEHNYTIFDIEPEVVKNGDTDKDIVIDEGKYVYDLYYTNEVDLGDSHLEDYVSVLPINDPLIFGSARDNGLNQDTSDDDSDDDSNAEANWRNNYPDESDMDSINEDDMAAAVKNCKISDDLSSDEGDEEFVYSVDDESGRYDEDVDEEDVNRYGKMYAKFKAKNTTGVEESELYCGDIDEDEYYY